MNDLTEPLNNFILGLDDSIEEVIESIERTQEDIDLPIDNIEI